MAKQRRRGRSNPELERAWRERISAWAASGQTARAYCRDHGLSQPSFYAWRRKLRQGDGRRSPSAAEKPCRIRQLAEPAHRPRLDRPRSSP